MISKVITSTIVFALLAISSEALAQGCSDAGFCTAGSLNPADNTDTVTKNSIGLSVTLGQGEQSTAITIFQLEYNRQIGHNSILEIKLPYYIATGTLGTNAVISDPVITYTHELWTRKNLILTGTAGMRISTGNANSRDNGISLPMPYQGNLGTTDLIVGFAFSWKKYLSAAIGLQQPVLHYNENAYYPAPGESKSFFASRKLVRKGDVLFRLDGKYQWNKFGIGAGPLFIYHLAEDEITLPVATGENKVAVTGSSGLTLNVTAHIFYKATNWQADINYGSPVIVRDARPDGLTRAWVWTPSFSYFF